MVINLLKAKVPCPSLDMVNSELKPKGKNWWHLQSSPCNVQQFSKKNLPQRSSKNNCQDMVAHSTQQPSLTQIFQQQIHTRYLLLVEQPLERNLLSLHFTMENWPSLILLKRLDHWTTGTNDRHRHQHPTSRPQRSWPFQRGALRSLELEISGHFYFGGKVDQTLKIISLNLLNKSNILISSQSPKHCKKTPSLVRIWVCFSSFLVQIVEMHFAACRSKQLYFVQKFAKIQHSA